MTFAAILFGVTALGGFYLLIVRLQGSPRPPTWLALGHGAFAVGGFVALLVHGLQAGLPPLAQYAFGAFILAALGGLTLFFFFHMAGKELPVPLILGHGLVGLAGLALLVASVIQNNPPTSTPLTTEPRVSSAARPAPPLAGVGHRAER